MNEEDLAKIILDALRSTGKFDELEMADNLLTLKYKGVRIGLKLTIIKK